MPKYRLTFAFAGEGAREIAKRKVVALGGDAKMLTPEEAKKAGVKAPDKADNCDAPPEYVVVFGLEAPAGP